MKLFLCTLINLSCEELNSEPENPLKYAISNQKLVYAQLLAWVSFCSCYYNKFKSKITLSKKNILFHERYPLLLKVLYSEIKHCF